MKEFTVYGELSTQLAIGNYNLLQYDVAYSSLSFPPQATVVFETCKTSTDCSGEISLYIQYNGEEVAYTGGGCCQTLQYTTPYDMTLSVEV
jgi:hypothetical protein